MTRLFCKHAGQRTLFPAFSLESRNLAARPPRCIRRPRMSHHGFLGAVGMGKGDVPTSSAGLFWRMLTKLSKLSCRPDEGRNFPDVSVQRPGIRPLVAAAAGP